MKRFLFFGFLLLPFWGWGQVVDTAGVRKTLDSLQQIAIGYLKQGNYEDGLRIAQFGIKTANDQFGKNHFEYAMLANIVGVFYDKMKKYEQAEPMYLESQEIFGAVAGKSHNNYVLSLINLASLYSRMGKYLKSESYYLEVIDIREKNLGKEHQDYARTLNDLAMLYRKMGRYESAENFHLQAKNIRAKVLGKEHTDYVWSLNNLANVYYDMGQYTNAESLFLEAKTIRERLWGTDNLDYAMTLNNLANLYHKMDREEEAEQMHLEAKKIRERKAGKEHPDYAQSLNNLGNFYKDMGQFEKAESVLLEAKSIIEKTLRRDDPFFISILNKLGDLYRIIGSYETSERILLEVQIIVKSTYGKESWDYVSNLHDLAVLYSDMGRYSEAEQLFLESVRIVDNQHGTGYSFTNVNTIKDLAILYADMNRYQEAEPLFIKVKDTYKSVLGKESASYAQSLTNLGILYRRMKQFQSASPYYVEANNLNRARLLQSSRFLSERELSDYAGLFIKQLNSFYSFVHLGENTQPEVLAECYNNTLFHKGFLISSVSRRNNVIQSDTTVQRVDILQKSYLHRLNSEYIKPIAERNFTQIAEWEEKANALEKELVRTIAGYGDLIRQVVWQEVQLNLRSGQATIEFIHYKFSNLKPTDSIMYAALVLMPTDTAPHFIPLCEERQLYALLPERKGPLANYLQNLYTSPRPDSLSSLYQLLWAPLEPLLKQHRVKTVYYSPSGLLHRLNLAAIASDKSGETLADRYRLIPMGSTRQLVTGSATAPAFVPSAGKTATIYGGIRYEMDSVAITQANSELKVVAQDTTGSGIFRYSNRSGERGDNWDYLPGTEKEAVYLHKLLKKQGVAATLRLGYSATEESFKQIGRDGPSPTLLHIGTHGFFFPDPKDTTRRRHTFGDDAPAFKISEHPLIRSGLKLAGSRYAWETKRPMHGMEDGILTAYEVSQMNLSNTELVVLSACETGLGDIKGNEGVYGLQRAFRIAGAKNVLMSLWKVSDQATEKLLTRFYGNWLERKLPLREAFEEAQKWLRGQEQYSNPFYWAGFVLIGE